MLGTVNVYVLWYGSFAGDTQLVLTDLLANIGVSLCSLALARHHPPAAHRH